MRKSFFSAIATLIGTTVGVGIFSIPYTVARSGFLIGLTYISVTSWRFITEEKEKRWLKKAFEQYLSPVVITEIMKKVVKIMDTYGV